MAQPRRSFNPWPALHPPELMRLANGPFTNSDINTPASSRYRATQNGTLQDEIDKLDWEEEQWFQSLHDTRSHGYAWLIPLGRQNTQEEDQESIFSPSPPASVIAENVAVEGVTDADMDAPDLDAAIEDADDSQLRDSAEEDEENDDEVIESGNGEDSTRNLSRQSGGVGADDDFEGDLDEGVEEPESEEESEEDSVEDASGNESNGGMEVE